MTRRKIFGVMAAVIAYALLCSYGECLGGDQAVEQLIEVFEKKGLLDASEAQLLRDTLAKEEEKALRREKEIEERERALEKREEELKKEEQALQEQALQEQALQEQALQGKATASPETGKKSAEKAIPEAEGKVRMSDAGGLCLSTQEPYPFSLCFDGLLQVDYQYFDYKEKNASKDRFDIRRARLSISGQALKYFDYKFQYEFQGASARNLLDAYVDANVLRPASFRVGQFKEPFGLEQSTDLANYIFTQPSYVYYLSPPRDVGVMAHSSLWDDRVNYGIGIFNGDGLDDSVGGNEDAPQGTARLVFSPFKTKSIPLIKNLQFGGSVSYANIDRNNVALDIKTPGLSTFFNVASSTKYRVIRDADSCTRYDAELGWAYGPLALMGEYAHILFRDVRTSTEQFNIGLRAYYISLLWMITGEEPSFRHGVFQAIEPAHSVFQGGWGALGLAFRYEAFNTDDEDVYQYLINQGDSVRKANSFSIALNWYLNRYASLMMDFSRTDFDAPLLTGRDPLNGTATYNDREDVFTGRFQFRF
jgi:phosphate-selective porin OprO/OprP